MVDVWRLKQSCCVWCGDHGFLIILTIFTSDLLSSALELTRGLCFRLVRAIHVVN